MRRRQIQHLFLMRVEVSELERAEAGEGEGKMILARLRGIEEAPGGDSVETRD